MVKRLDIKKMLDIKKYIMKRQKKWNNIKRGLVPLVPNKAATNVKAYVDALTIALKDSDVRNIGVTGKYGAGKSSFLRTFFNRRWWKFLHRQPLWVSTASFASLASKKKDSQGSEEISQEQLESWVLGQLLYVEKERTISFSLFNKFYNKSVAKVVCIYFVWFLTFLSLIILSRPNCIFSHLNDFGLNDEGWIRFETIGAIIYLVMASFIFFIWAYVAFLKGQLKVALKLGPTAVGSDGEASKNNVFNKNLEELIYFFRTTRRWVVIFEDMDRYEDRSIFVKLRALNSLLNSACNLNRPLKFIYAVSDDLIADPCERVKFFDFIISVMPILSFEMVVGLFNAILAKVGVTKDIISKCEPAIKIASQYINDCRLVYSICNDFLIMNSIFEENLAESENKLNSAKMMALAIFKAFYPGEYAKLANGDNVLERLLTDKGTKIQAKKQIIATQLKSIQDGIRRLSKGAIAKDILELNKKYLIDGLLKVVPQDTTSLQANPMGGRGKLMPLCYYFDPSHIEELVDKELSFMAKDRFGGLSQIARLQWVDVEKKVGNGSYKKQRGVLDQLAKNDMSKLSYEQESKLIEMEKVETTSLAQLVKSGEICKSSDAFGKEIFDLEKMPVLRAMLAMGVIAEDYRVYTTLYHGGDISAQDYNYIVAVRQGLECGLEYSVEKPEKVVTLLQDYDFLKKEALNFDVLAWLIKNAYSNPTTVDEETRTRCKQLVAYMISRPSELSARKLSPKVWFKFLKSKSSMLNKELFEAFNECETDLFIDLLDDDDLTDEEKVDLMVYVYIIIQSNDGLIELEEEHWALIKNRPDLGSLLRRMDIKQEVVLKAIDEGVEFGGHVFDDEPYRGFNEDVLNKDAYLLSFDAIAGALKAFGKSCDGLEFNMLTVVRESGIEPLINRIRKSFRDFIENVYLKLQAQSEDVNVLMAVLNDSAISIEDKEAFVLKQVDIVVTINDIESDDVVKLLWKHPKCNIPIDDAKQWFRDRKERLCCISDFLSRCGQEYTDRELAQFQSEGLIAGEAL